MKVDDKFQILKFFAAVFNSVFLILGLCIFGCAVWILFDKDNFISVLSSVEVKTVAGGLFIIGLVVVGVTILGCMGAQLENRCFLLLYMGFLICIVLGQLFVTFIILLNHGKITSKMKIEVDKIITEYGTNPDNQRHWKLLDNVQRYGHCCGMQSPNDWQSNMFIKNNSLIDVYPCSCFNTTDCPAISGFSTLLFGNGNETQIHPQSCVDIITNWLKENTLTIVGMEVGLLIVQVLQFIVAVYLYQTVGQKAKLRNGCQLIRSEEHCEPNPDFLDDPDYPDQNHAYPEPNQAYAHTNLVYPEQIIAYPEEILAYSDDQHQADFGPNHSYHH
ncbi:CD82 antigen isoform X1 [Salmo trutta]|uniref:CD82 antigen isoform X1 n=1 Tax=Salmo trutta TaxID=8032 RepID=UPI0011319119|nr:CD82 antigen-like isoform X1 [Salmo trutta]